MSRIPTNATYKRAVDVYRYVASRNPETTTPTEVSNALGLSKPTVYNTVSAYPEMLNLEAGIILTSPALLSWFEVREMRARPEGVSYGGPASVTYVQPVATGQQIDSNSIPVAEYTREQAKALAHKYADLPRACHGLLWLAVHTRAAAEGQPLEECRPTVVAWLREAVGVIERDYDPVK